MPVEVIERVHAMAKQAPGTPIINFPNRAGVPFDDDDLHDDDIYGDDADSDDDDEYNPDDDENVIIAGVNEADADEDIEQYDEQFENEANDDEQFENEANDDEVEAINDEAIIENENENEAIIENENENENEAGLEIIEEIMDPPIDANDMYEPNDIGTRMDNIYGPRSGAYNLRERKPRDFGHLHANITSLPHIEKALFPPNTGWAVEKKPWKPKAKKCKKPKDYHHGHDVLESFVMTQHNVRKGLKIFGDAGVEAVLKELTQLHDRRVLKPKEASKLSNEERKDSLQYLMFLKEKRDGSIKGRGCADGRKQRLHTTKEEASSPTVAIESVMLS